VIPIFKNFLPHVGFFSPCHVLTTLRTGGGGQRPGKGLYRKYWSNVFAMAGAASLAVAFINGDPIAFYAGLGFCLYGLKLNREKR